MSGRNLFVSRRTKKLVSRWQWTNDRQRLNYCKACADFHKNRPPCHCGEGCEYSQPPPLASQNEETWILWTAVSTQWRAGGFSIIGLDYNVLYQEAKRLEIELTDLVMQKIRALEHHQLNHYAAGNSNNSDQGSGPDHTP